LILGIAGALVAVEGVLPLLLWLARDRVLFHPDPFPATPRDLATAGPGVDLKPVRVPRPGGERLAAFDARPAGVDPDAGPVVLFFHGNAGNVAGRAGLLGDFVRGTGCRTLLFDYSGFGGNGGSPSAEAVVVDGIAASDFLRVSGVSPARVVLFGESLGGAVALEVAARRPCAGVVVQSGFSSLSSMALRLYPWMPLLSVFARSSFRSSDRAADLSVPFLVVHGRRDDVVPFAEGEALHRAAPGTAEFLALDAAGHDDLFARAGPEYLRGLGERFRLWTRSR